MSGRARWNFRIGAICLGIVALLGVASLVWTPHDPNALDLDSRFAAPGGDHWLGTDEFGRDVLSRLMVAARVSLAVALGATFCAVIAGMLLGACAAYFRGFVERVVLVVCDALMAFPALLLALGIMAVLGPQSLGVVLALGLAYMPNVMRVTRAVALSLAEREFVRTSLAFGRSGFGTVVRHILPNCISPLTVAATTLFGAALLSETALSFLGIGVAPPTASWGGMMADGRQFLRTTPLLVIVPGVAVSCALLGVNLLGDALRDRLDPRMAKL